MAQIREFYIKLYAEDQYLLKLNINDQVGTQEILGIENEDIVNIYELELDGEDPIRKVAGKHSGLRDTPGSGVWSKSTSSQKTTILLGKYSEKEPYKHWDDKDLPATVVVPALQRQLKLCAPVGYLDYGEYKGVTDACPRNEIFVFLHHNIPGDKDYMIAYKISIVNDDKTEMSEEQARELGLITEESKNNGDNESSGGGAYKKKNRRSRARKSKKRKVRKSSRRRSSKRNTRRYRKSRKQNRKH
jgi:hypothetical protein